MELKEALKDTGIAEAWYDGYTAVAVKQGAHYTLTVQRGKKPPHFVREGISLEQAEKEWRMLNPSHLTDWTVVELEG